ncbi:MAG: VIT family protein [Acidimicrobiia bacterium]|jgi:VIT1/CCC1 family predicted Fe2+/Mn2+ transporter|nr:VIT family protein [Acidimicrobiia bacterium]
MLPHRERHRFERIGWLRAAVLGANDGIVSTASLMIGVAASSASTSAIAVAGLAGLAAGAMSMAVGEYVSVSSQRDTENADIRKEEAELQKSPDSELNELTHIYVQRGLEPVLARSVAEQLTAADPLGAHLRDELGITHATKARPWQAAFVSVISFGLGAAIPLLALAVAGGIDPIAVIAIAALVVLAITGAVGGRLGGAPVPRAALRVLVGGGAAMAITALVGNLIGTSV